MDNISDVFEDNSYPPSITRLLDRRTRCVSDTEAVRYKKDQQEREVPRFLKGQDYTREQEDKLISDTKTLIYGDFGNPKASDIYDLIVNCPEHGALILDAISEDKVLLVGTMMLLGLNNMAVINYVKVAHQYKDNLSKYYHKILTEDYRGLAMESPMSNFLSSLSPRRMMLSVYKLNRDLITEMTGMEPYKLIRWVISWSSCLEENEQKHILDLCGGIDEKKVARGKEAITKLMEEVDSYVVKLK